MYRVQSKCKPYKVFILPCTQYSAPRTDFEVNMKVDKILDCTGLFCPMPIAQARMEMDKMKPGEILEITADDAGFEKDLPAWCKMSGEEFIEIKKDGNILKGYVRKS